MMQTKPIQDVIVGIPEFSAEQFRTLLSAPEEDLSGTEAILASNLKNTLKSGRLWMNETELGHVSEILATIPEQAVELAKFINAIESHQHGLMYDENLLPAVKNAVQALAEVNTKLPQNALAALSRAFGGSSW